MDNKSELVKAGLRMKNSGLTVSTWGNISIRDPNTGLIYLTPSAMEYDTITEDDIVVTDIAGNIIQGSRKPTIESELHLNIYRHRPNVNAILHTHPIYSLVFAVLGEDMPPVIDEAAQAIGGTVRVADYALPGTKELADNCLKALGDNLNACLLQAHGAVCLGCSMDEAFKVSTVLEITAQVYYMALGVGVPKLISNENIAIMFDFAKNKYGQCK